MRAPSLVRDDRLAARAAKGDRGAFAELYRRHHQRLYRYCLSLVGDPEDAADALQTAMAKAMAALERGEKVKALRPWLFRIAHNTAIDMVRARKPRAPVEEIEASALTVPSTATEAQRREDLAEVVADIRALSERQGSALVMRELSELSYAEISVALDTSPLAARQLVHQARSLLHDNREGRGMDCEKVRQELGDSNGKRPRDRRMRAHLAACQSCTAFGQGIRTRRSALAAFAPPLAPVAASEILGRLLESGTGGAGVAAGGVGAGITKVAGASGVAKVAGAAAAGAAAVAALGGVVVAGGAPLGDDEVTSRLRPPAAEALLRPDLPALRPMPEPLRRSAGKSRGGERSAGEPASSKTDSRQAASSVKRPSGPSGPSSGGVAQVDLGGDDAPVDLGIVDRPDRDDLKVVDRTVSTAKVPDLPDVAVDVPGGSGGSQVEVPPVDMPEVQVPEVDIPEVDVPGGSVPGSVPGGSGGSGVETPRVEVPEVEVPTGGSGSSGSGGAQIDVPEVDVPGPSVDVPSSVDAAGSSSQGSGSGSSGPGL